MGGGELQAGDARGSGRAGEGEGAGGDAAACGGEADGRERQRRGRQGGRGNISGGYHRSHKGQHHVVRAHNGHPTNRVNSYMHCDTIVTIVSKCTQFVLAQGLHCDAIVYQKLLNWCWPEACTVILS